MLKNGKAYQYILYALGEILLVVIGILIALQINNWNENKKDRKFESEILIQIRDNLKEDKMALKEFATNGYKAQKAIMNLLDNTKVEKHQDSIQYWLGKVIFFDRFQPLTNAYEVLKSKGIDLIRQKQLRSLLGAYYDDKSQHIIKACGDIEHTFLNDWVPMIDEFIVDQSFKEYVILDNYDIVMNGLGKRYLILNKDNWGGTINSIEDGIILIDEILKLIKEEIG